MQDRAGRQSARGKDAQRRPSALLARAGAETGETDYPVFVDRGTAVVDKNNVDLYLAQEKEAEKK
ncbi:MAG TPA: hypothetical protein VMU92_00125 [Acidobacteriaceae bacterium]|nr:hypothetical protein [Acidobacteriaceae bacterium]